MVLTRSAWNLSVMALGVPAGMNTPHQFTATSPGTDSAQGGSSGMMGLRSAPVTHRARALPALMNCIAGNESEKMYWMCPATRSRPKVVFVRTGRGCAENPRPELPPRGRRYARAEESPGLWRGSIRSRQHERHPTRAREVSMRWNGAALDPATAGSIRGLNCPG